MSLFPKTNPHMLPHLIPTHSRGHNHAHSKDKDVWCRAVEGLAQGRLVIRMHKVSNPSDLPIPIIHSMSQSCLLPQHQRSKGEGEGGGGGREGREEEGSPPSPQQVPFWSGERLLMKAPQMPLSWRCQPGSPAELRGEHLCSQLAHGSSIKAHACCQEQRPGGQPF